MQPTTCPMCDAPSTSGACCSPACTSHAERELQDNAARARRANLPDDDREHLLARNAVLMRGLLGRVRRSVPDRPTA